jgi:hypothetical protein
MNFIDTYNMYWFSCIGIKSCYVLWRITCYCIGIISNSFQVVITLASIVSFWKLFILLSEIVAFSINNHQLFFSLAIPSFLYTNNGENNDNKTSILNKDFEFLNSICVEKHKNKLKLESRNWWHNRCQLTCNDNVHVTLLKPFLNFDSMPKILTFTNMPFCKSCSYTFI